MVGVRRGSTLRAGRIFGEAHRGQGGGDYGGSHGQESVPSRGGTCGVVVCSAGRWVALSVLVSLSQSAPTIYSTASLYSVW